MRKLISKYGLHLLAACLLLAACGAYYINRAKSPRVLTKAYFLDEVSGAEMIRPISDIPPLKDSDGKESIVREYKYSCDDGATVKVGYYIKFKPETKAKLESFSTQEARDQYDASGGAMVRSPEPGSKWVPFNSSEGQELTTIHCPEGHFITAMFP